MSELDLNVVDIPEGEDPHLTLDLLKDDIPASVKITLHFEGDWANIYDDEDETEYDARGAVATELFRAVINQIK